MPDPIPTPKFDVIDNTEDVLSFIIRAPMGWAFDEVDVDGDEPAIYFKPDPEA
jgi:hypothetical protein